MADLADVTYLLQMLKSRQKDYALYRDYAAGRHRLAFASDAFRSAFGSLFKQFAYNRCQGVVDALTDRLYVTGWENEGAGRRPLTGAGPVRPDPLVQAAEAVWDRNMLDAQQGKVYEESATLGDAYVVVWPGPDGLARIVPNPGHCCCVLTDEESGATILGVKVWRVSRGPYAKQWRVTVYEPDRITKYVTAGAADERPEKAEGLRLYEDDEGGPELANPYGVVPLIHFPNNPRMDGWGVSELRDVIPLQDGLNKSVADQLVASEFLAYGQRYAIGVEPEVDPATGEERMPFRPGIDRVWMVANEAARFGEFAATPVTGFLEAEDAWEVKIARVSKTPLSWLTQTGAAESGESKKMDEAPFVSKVIDRQRTHGPQWADAMALALAIDGAPGDAATLAPTWANAEPRSERDAWEVGQLKIAAGVPQEQVWSENGYQEDEVVEFAALKEQRAQEQAERFATSFDRGRFGEE